MSSPGGNKWQHQLPLRDELKNHLLVGHSCKYTPRTAAGFNTSNPQETSPKFPELSAVIMHIHMEMSLGTPCIATFTSNKQRCHLFIYLFIYLLFFFYKIREQEGRIGPPQGRGGWYQWEGEVVGKGSQRVNMVQKMCTHICKCKKETC
jgi:hypothetical protein